MRQLPWLAVLLAGAIALPTLASAAVEKFVIDPVHSDVSFTVKHFVSKVPGRFGDFSGEILVDPKDPSTLSVSGTIVTKSIDTNNEKRDGHLRSPDFFDVEKYPEITFKSKTVTKNGDRWAVTGDLTMHGVTKEVTLDTEVLGFAGPNAGLEATGRIPRKDFGVSWNRTLDDGGVVLGEDVDVVIRIEAKKEQPPQAKR